MRCASTLAWCLSLMGLQSATASPAFDPIVARQGLRRPTFFKGHDLSSLKILENGGAIYHDTSRHNATRFAEDILGDGGMNTVRLRLWTNPTSGQYDLPYVLDMAKRFHKKNYHIYLDFHFSSDWADPQHNIAPVGWPNSIQPLSKTLRTYVTDTLHAFWRAGIPLSLVSLGNEIRHGMLWPLGRADVDIPQQARVANFTNLATLFHAARQGVDDAVHSGVPKPQVMIHIDNGWNKTLQENWFNAFFATKKAYLSDIDVFGFSFYPFYGTSATFANLETTLAFIAEKYKKPVHVVETDYPAICSGSDAPALSEPSIPISVQGQIEWVHKVIEIVKGVPNGLGQGFNYWEPAWLNLTSLGSACQDAILFDTDWSQWPKMLAYSRESVNMLKGV